MSASSSNFPLKSTAHGYSHKRKKSKEVDLQRKRLLIAPPSMNRTNGDEQSSETGCESDLDFPISTTVRYTAKEPYSVNRGDGAVQRGESLSMSLLQGSSNFNINNSDFNQIYGDATIIRFGDGQFTEAQRSLICEHIASLATLPGIGRDLNKNIPIESIRDLPRAEAVFDDYQTKKKSGPCFEGTRVALLREMANWITGTDESRLYVLSGLAGIGKSTVAYTIASRAADLNLLGASFFFSRDESDRKNAKKFFTTIAYQLCTYNETVAKAIGDVLQTQHGFAAITKGPLEQLQALIVEPLQDIAQSHARPVLVVVDALDECDERDRLSVLTGLRKLVQALPSFKVVLTTRPQLHVERVFGNQDGHKIFHLQDIEDKVVDGDIRLYLKHCLSLEHVQERLPSRRWCANDDEIDCLVRAAGRLFIIASTVVRIILDQVAFNPAARMQKLLGTFSQDRMPFRDLNEFYTVILRNAVPVDCDNDISKRYQSVVGAIIFAQHPLPVTTLAHLIGTDVEDVRAVLVNLQSVILLDDNDTPCIYHKSFPDYITDSKLCQDGNLHIDPMVTNVWMIIRCFQIMEQYLKYNILGLGTPARFMNNEHGLAKDGIKKEQLDKNIPRQLQYACVYWAHHLSVENIEDTNVMIELQQFANKHMLHWFEVLSLIGKLDSAHRAIRVVRKLLKSTSSDLHQLLSDGLRFISKFYATIERSALHTYYSALPFTPTGSHLYRRYVDEKMHSICDIQGGPEKWDALIANLRHGEEVDNVKFSLDNNMLASMGKEMLKIWDAATGTPISTISRGCFVIANDFSTVVSFKSNTITLYDIDGSERGVFTTPAEILRVAISSESSRIAATLFNETFLLWDSGSGRLILSDQDQDTGRNQNWGRLEFSSTGARLAYPLPGGCFVHLRNGIDGRIIADLDCESALYRFAFSADGSRIATLSRSDLKLWSCEDGELVGFSDYAGYEMAISANGSLLATGDDKVMLWSGSTENRLLRVEVVDLNCPVRTMAFALDDTLAISAGKDIMLYNPKSRSFISQLSFSGPIAFSPDSTRLAAWSSKGIVSLWDIQYIEVSSPSLNKRTQDEINVMTMALSRDCSRVACGFSDGTVGLWGTGTLTEQPIATHKRHLKWVKRIRWSPNGKRFVSLSRDGTINLWDGESGEPCGALQGCRPAFSSNCSYAMETSDTVLAVASDDGLLLWDLETLRHIRTFNGSFKACLSFSTNGTLLAVVRRVASNVHYRLRTPLLKTTIILDVKKCTIISRFGFDSYAMAFLPDNSKLAVQQSDGNILAFNLDDQKLEQGPISEDFIQLLNVPLCLGAPVSTNYKDGQYYLGAAFSRRNRHVPVLWMPQELVYATAEARSLILLRCANERFIFLRPRTTIVV